MAKKSGPKYALIYTHKSSNTPKIYNIYIVVQQKNTLEIKQNCAQKLFFYFFQFLYQPHKDSFSSVKTQLI